ncbi:MAG: AraC family transcriptional regulator [Tissierellia bacterium]|nr:AraC family transcriptional regulator [Tissierellia bacterium]
MDISIQKKPGFIIAGYKMEAIDSSLCPQAWEKLFEQNSLEDLEKMGNGQSYGVCFDIEDVKHINYMAAYDVKDKDLAEKMNLEIIEIPENEYAIVELKGEVPKCIHEGWKYIMEVFFPEHGYMHSGAPDFEVYKEGDMNSFDYEMELWVPIKKVKSTK